MVCLTDNIVFTTTNDVAQCRIDDVGDDELFYVGTFYKEAPINEQNLEMLMNVLNARWGFK